MAANLFERKSEKVMFIYQVVGFRKYSGEYEGRKYSGYFLHCVGEPQRDDVEGQVVTELKIKEKLGYIPRVGDMIQITYNQYGICDVKVI